MGNNNGNDQGDYATELEEQVEQLQARIAKLEAAYEEIMAFDSDGKRPNWQGAYNHVLTIIEKIKKGEGE